MNQSPPIPMLNSIPQDQNQTGQIEQLAAQRQLYSQATRYITTYFILAVPVAIAASVVAIIYKPFGDIASVYALIIQLLEITFFEKREKDLKQQGAQVQELFDHEVLKTRWNQTKAGNRPTPEAVSSAAAAYGKSHTDNSDLLDWYPAKDGASVGEVPLSLARIICQRTNIWWDASLRRRYSTVLWFIAITVPVLGYALGALMSVPADRLLVSVFIPLSPVVTWALKERNKQTEAAKTLDRLLGIADELWQEALKQLRNDSLSEQQLDEASRDLQNEIYDHRRSNPPIFDWIYKRLRDENEELMNKIAEKMIQEAKRN